MDSYLLLVKKYVRFSCRWSDLLGNESFFHVGRRVINDNEGWYQKKAIAVNWYEQWTNLVCSPVMKLVAENLLTVCFF